MIDGNRGALKFNAWRLLCYQSVRQHCMRMLVQASYKCATMFLRFSW